HTEGVTTVALSPDRNTLAAAGKDGTIRLWDLTTGKKIATYHGHPGGCYAVAFEPYGRFLASAGGDARVKFWDMSAVSGPIPPAPLADLRGHDGAVLSLAFSGNGTRLAAGGSDGNVSVWDVDTKARVALRKGPGGKRVPKILAVAFPVKGGNLLAWGGE